MERDIINDEYYETRRESTSEALLLDQLDAEKDHLVELGYSEQQRFINIRPIAFHYCVKYALPNGIVAYRALTSYDRFLSRNIDIPVVIQGGGFERNLELFAFACVVIASREKSPQSFNFHHFVDTHKMADEKDVEKMELLIRKGLEGSVTTPPTALEPLIIDPLISLLEMEDEQVPELVYYVDQILFAINDDIKFTKFRPSILTASAILVTCYRLYPVLYPAIAKKILKSGYVQEVRMSPAVRKFVRLSKIQECFDEMKDHVIVDFVFSPEKCPTLYRYRGNVRREQGKKLLIDDPPEPYVYVPDFEHPLEFFLEDYENKIDEFRAERQNQEHTSRVTEQKEEEEEEHRELTSEITEEEEIPEYESESEKKEDTEQEEYQEHSSEIATEEKHEEDTSEIKKEEEEEE